MDLKVSFRDPDLLHRIIDEIKHTISRPWVIMEICGGQTHSIMRHGLHQLLPPEIELIHGPGCPVCVTSIELIDKAISIASNPDVIFTSYGDMLRVPGSKLDLYSVKANGGDIRVVYSPLDAINIAQQNPAKQVVFFAIGFETTAPANAMTVLMADKLNLANYSMLVGHVRVPPAIQAILGSHENRVQAFLAAGHVCTVMGYWEYFPISDTYHIPIVITGFEPVDIAQGILFAVRQLEHNKAEVENAYSRVVTQPGNIAAQTVINQVFKTCDRNWRGIGIIPNSGWALQDKYERFDAELKFEFPEFQPEESSLCISGQILQGIIKPPDCPAFAVLCSPENPLGATMVSSEGACAAYYHYNRGNL